jgi:tetratricopeptide (TPR) repeat protein
MARIQILNVGWRLGASEEEAAVTFTEGKALAERSGDMSALALVIAVYASVAGLAGDAGAYVSYGMEAVRVADQTENPGLRTGCRSILTVGHWFAGHLAEALSFAELQLIETREDPKLGADIFGFNLHAHALMFRASVVSAMGRHEEARENIDRALRVARQHNDAEVLSASHGIIAWLAWNTGCTHGALDHARRGVEIAEKTGSPVFRAFAYQFLGVALVETEQWSEAAAALEQALLIARETRTGLAVEATILTTLAGAYFGLGQNRRACAAADESLAVACRGGSKLWECLAHLARARVHLWIEGAAASANIQTALNEAQRLVEETGGRSQQPFIHEERANLARLTGDDATCQRELREAHRLFTEMGATGHAERLAKELGL